VNEHQTEWQRALKQDPNEMDEIEKTLWKNVVLANPGRRGKPENEDVMPDIYYKKTGKTRPEYDPNEQLRVK